MRTKIVLLMLFYLTSFTSVFAVTVKVKKDIAYPSASSAGRNQLDVYYPKDTSTPKDVLVFIHGGAWDSGKKDIYWWLGRNLASKNVVAVIINYPLSPKANYEEMAYSCAEALKWVKDSVGNFGGDPGRIFAMGHSAGGHLSALIDLDPSYFAAAGISNPLRGVILNDGFGLDMEEYLRLAPPDALRPSFLKTFSEDPANWKKGSPLTYFDQLQHPYYILVGEDTYEAIKIQSKRFYEMLNGVKKPVKYQLMPQKTHRQMISQLVFGANDLYPELIAFMQAH